MVSSGAKAERLYPQKVKFELAPAIRLIVLAVRSRSIALCSTNQRAVLVSGIYFQR